MIGKFLCAIGLHDPKYIGNGNPWITYMDRHYVCRRCKHRYVKLGKGEYRDTEVNKTWLNGGPWKKRDIVASKVNAHKHPRP